MTEKKSIYFNYVSNLLRQLKDGENQKAKEKIKLEVQKHLVTEYSKSADFIVNRMIKLKAVNFIKIPVDFMDKFKECISCYVNGFDLSVITLCGLIGEQVTFELLKTSEIAINGQLLDNRRKQGFMLKTQENRLKLLEKVGILDPEPYGKLDQIRIKRNQYIHPTKILNPEKDSLDMINLLISVICKLFEEKDGAKHFIKINQDGSRIR
ncbi:MAG: hypothetical protein KAT43_01290 [Nanoarchaeota archaeon]|nr:hypothetical protein [Nanoarchaeota archaeon]